MHRRKFLSVTSASLFAAASCAQASAYPFSQDSAADNECVCSRVQPAIERPHGAVYVPARAYNAFQMWRDYRAGITRRDAGYVRSLRNWMTKIR